MVKSEQDKVVKSEQDKLSGDSEELLGGDEEKIEDGGKSKDDEKENNGNGNGKDEDEEEEEYIEILHKIQRNMKRKNKEIGIIGLNEEPLDEELLDFYANFDVDTLNIPYTVDHGKRKKVLNRFCFEDSLSSLLGTTTVTVDEGDEADEGDGGDEGDDGDEADEGDEGDGGDEAELSRDD